MTETYISRDFKDMPMITGWENTAEDFLESMANAYEQYRDVLITAKGISDENEKLKKGIEIFNQANFDACEREDKLHEKINKTKEDLDFITREYLAGAGDIYLKTLMNRIRLKHAMEAR